MFVHASYIANERGVIVLKTLLKKFWISQKLLQEKESTTTSR